MARELVQRLRERAGREIAPPFEPGIRRMAMAYPSPYRAGMSSLGFQWITMLLREAGIATERVFLPDEPAAWRRHRTPPLSYETLTPLGQFPLVGISLAYELELAGLFDLLELAGIPPLREDRGIHDPLILLGGPISMASPLAAAPFVDAMLLGECEETAPPAATSFFDCDSRESWLDALEQLPGAYIPERHGSRLPSGAKASDALLPARSGWITPDAELSDMFLLEGERGCHRMCTFCVMRRTTNGGMRLVTPERVLSLLPDHAQRVGLVGAAISDHPKLTGLLDTLVQSGRQVSLSSLRADRVARRPRIAELLRSSGARTLTVASDGASQRLRDSLLKKTTEATLLECARQVGHLGYDIFKVYMVIGVPGETEADIDELVRFTLELSRAAGRARVAMGVAPFVAKKNTPLDGIPFAGIKVIERRMKQLKRGLRGTAEVRPVSARWAWVEHELSQGGPEVGLAALEAWKAGGHFAAWKRALEAVDRSTRRPWHTPDCLASGGGA